MNHQVVQCPLAGALVPMITCLACAFHHNGVDCPQYHKALPEAYCVECIKSGVGVKSNCPYYQLTTGKLVNPQTPVLLPGFCGLPHMLKVGAFTDTPNAILTAALPKPDNDK